MKYLKLLLVFIAFAVCILNTYPVKAQCTVCSVAVESNKAGGGTAGNGLNHGIMYLLAAPYIAVAAVGFLWYKKYRRKNVSINMRDEKLNLN